MNQDAILFAIAWIAGAIISILTTVVPKFNTWYSAQTSAYKALLQIGFDVVGAILIIGAACLKVTTLVSCDISGVQTLAIVLAGTLTGGQVAFTLTPTRKVLPPS